MTASLTGRIALVTGASRGIGAAIARRLAADGAHVFATYARDAEAAAAVVADIEGAGGRATAVQADIGDAAAVDALFDEVEAAGGPHVLVNNAGVTKDGLVLTLRAGDWERVLRTNLDGTFRCLQRGLRTMLRARAGRVVNVASIAGIHGGRGQANYAASKAGILALTRAAALEVADRGITINAVLPGFIETDMTRRLAERAGDRILERIPAGRYGQPADVAGLVAFLCGDEAAYVTGQGFVVDGGLSIG